MIDSTVVMLLCQKTHRYVIKLKDELLNSNIETFIIEDLSIPSEYNGLCHIGEKIEGRYKTTAWDNVFYFIFNNCLQNNIEYFYFIEDDVYSKNLKTFLNLIYDYKNLDYHLISNDIQSKKVSKHWNWWTKDEDTNYFDCPYRSFNPICRLSINLIKKIYDYHKSYNRFFYHEFLFASICYKYNLSMINFNSVNNKYIGNIRYRPLFNERKIRDNRIYHPVKTYETMDDR